MKEEKKPAPLSYADNPELVRRTAAGDEAAAEKLLELNRGLVVGLARRFLGRGAEAEDLIQLGSIGLFKAARSFDEGRATAFSTYATPLILGEIRKYLRDNGQIKVSRRQKQLGAMVLRERERISAETGREARVSEIAKRLGVPFRDAADALDAVSAVVSLSEPVAGEKEDRTLAEVLACRGDEAEETVERIALEAAVKKLPPFWRSLLSLRYGRELSQQKTAEILGVTQVKISREEKKMLEFLRRELASG